MKPTDSVTVHVFVAVDPASAFAVFTEEVDAWWKRGPVYRCSGSRHSVMRFDPGPGGRLLEVLDETTGEAYEIGRVRVWEPGARLVFEFRGPNFETGQSTEVEVRFVADGTRVSVEHRGWDSLPEDHPARHGLDERAFARLRGGWWLELLRALRARTARRGSR